MSRALTRDGAAMKAKDKDSGSPIESGMTGGGIEVDTKCTDGDTKRFYGSFTDIKLT